MISWRVRSQKMFEGVCNHKHIITILSEVLALLKTPGDRYLLTLNVCVSLLGKRQETDPANVTCQLSGQQSRVSEG